jgi:anti-sigma regulatory factor (Ser/Thr protein kinase)
LYAYPKKIEQDISIEAVKQNDALIFIITDTGVAFDPTQGGSRVDITLPARERPVGGLGIFLIKKIMDEVEYQRIDGANVFTLKKTLE